jgi:hypothetical protein
LHVPPTWQSAIPQVWKPAPRCGNQQNVGSPRQSLRSESSRFKFAPETNRSNLIRLRYSQTLNARSAKGVAKFRQLNVGGKTQPAVIAGFSLKIDRRMRMPVVNRPSSSIQKDGILHEETEKREKEEKRGKSNRRSQRLQRDEKASGLGTSGARKILGPGARVHLPALHVSCLLLS